LNCHVLWPDRRQIRAKTGRLGYQSGPGRETNHTSILSGANNCHGQRDNDVLHRYYRCSSMGVRVSYSRAAAPGRAPCQWAAFRLRQATCHWQCHPSRTRGSAGVTRPSPVSFAAVMILGSTGSRGYRRRDDSVDSDSKSRSCGKAGFKITRHCTALT
jgi:hypothetical protein